jgi:hypothetical protein
MTDVRKTLGGRRLTEGTYEPINFFNFHPLNSEALPAIPDKAPGPSTLNAYNSWPVNFGQIVGGETLNL